MNNPKKSNNLIQEVLLLLKPMGDVDYLITDDSLMLKKDTSIFGKIVGKNIYLLDNNKSFQQIDTNILNVEDEFLKEATRSYWISKENI